MTLNINGAQGLLENDGETRDLGKLETLARCMCKEEIDIYLVQETWMLKTWDVQIGDVKVFHHGPESKSCARGSGGVAILLGKRATRAWYAAGKPDLLQPGPLAGETTVRFMAITLKFPAPGRNKQAESFWIGNVYAPDHGSVDRARTQDNSPHLLDRFWQQIEHFLTDVPTNTQIVLGGDYNASLGRRDDTAPPEYHTSLGPFGLPHRNEAGERVLDLAQTHQLRVNSSFFRTRKLRYTTHYDQRHKPKLPRQLDHFLSRIKLGARVHKCGVYDLPNGVVSDHHSVRIKISLRRRMTRHQKQPAPDTEPPLPRPVINWRRANCTIDPEASQKYRTLVQQYAMPLENAQGVDPAVISDAINRAGAEALSEIPDPESNWWDANEHILRPLRNAHRELDKQARSSTCPYVKRRKNEAKRRYDRAQRAAKTSFDNTLAAAAGWEAMCEDPKKAWDKFRRHLKGSFAHHRPDTELCLEDPTTGRTATDPDDTLRIVGDYSHKLFNRDDAPVDWTVLDDIQQRSILYEIADPPTLAELDEALRSLRNNKAPGKSGIPAEAIKALPRSTREHVVLPMFQRYYKGETDSFEEWETAILKFLYKGKGSAKRLKNYRGIVLQDIFARLFSAMIGKRLSRLLKHVGIEEQFGCQTGRGVIDANYVLRTLLQLRQMHDLDTHVLFVDLIKAFDTANHELLFKLLAKFGCPEPLIDVIRRLHDSFFLEFTLDKKRKCLIPYGIGVRQGDNMAGLLFLFLMQAFHEVMTLEFEKNGRELPSVFSPLEDEILIRGQLTTQPRPERTTGRVTKVADTLFVDDGAFPFNSREEMGESLPLIKHTFSRFGLLMHVGELKSDGTLIPSKTEAVFFPARPTQCAAQDLTPDRIFFGESEQFHIHYTDAFKYLGSHLVPSLSDGYEIDRRLKFAAAQVREMDNTWKSSMDLRSKKLFFLQIPLNTALFGCEYWALTDSLRAKLSAFYHRGLRRVLGLNMHDVERDRIRNEHLRNKLGVYDIVDIIRYRQSNFIGKLARMPAHRLPRRMLGAWIPTTRKRGAAPTTTAKTFVDTIQAILGVDTCTDHGLLTDWLPFAEQKTDWDRLRTDLLSQSRKKSARHGTGSLGDPLLPEWLITTGPMLF